MRIAIIGGGISGLSMARMLKNRYDVTIFEGDNRPGGLIKCDRVQGNLFHRTGGHVFNSKRQDVLDWFWAHFDKDKEFTKARRNAVVSMSDNKIVPYPIENHVYYFDEKIQKAFIQDMLTISNENNFTPTNFEEFLVHRFGKTLYELYFKPYNYKVWRRDLSKVPLSWLEGKLPMPTIEEMFYNNMNRVDEQNFVHSSFYYAKKDGSQFIIDRLAEGLNIQCNSHISQLERKNNQWIILGQNFDKVIYCGNVKQVSMLFQKELNLSAFESPIEALEYHGTTTVLCEINKNDYSWVYQPSIEHESHRIICTGNFSETNNAEGKLSVTIEFTDEISKDGILNQLEKIPFNPIYLTHHYAKYTYPIQDKNTKSMIQNLKDELKNEQIYLLGRFAEWEYYNMDAAIGAALDLSKRL